MKERWKHTHSETMLTADSRRHLRLMAMLTSATRSVFAELDELDAHEIKEQLLSCIKCGLFVARHDARFDRRRHSAHVLR